MEKHLSLMTVIAGVAILSMVSTLAITNMSSSDSTASTLGGSIGMVLGHVTITVYDEDGNIKKYIQGDNLLMNEGENCIAEDLFDIGTSALCDGTEHLFSDVLIGTSNQGEDATQTALTEVLRTNTSATVVITSTAGVGSTFAVITITSTFTDPANTAGTVINEAALMDLAPTGGVGDILLARDIFAAATLGTSDDIVVTWTITIGA